MERENYIQTDFMGIITQSWIISEIRAATTIGAVRRAGWPAASLDGYLQHEIQQEIIARKMEIREQR